MYIGQLKLFARKERERTTDDLFPLLQTISFMFQLLRGVTVMGNPDADEYVTLFQLQYRLNDGSGSYATYQEPYGIPMVGSQNTLDQQWTSQSIVAIFMPVFMK